MFRYALIDDTGKCIGTSYVYEVVEGENIVPLSETDDVEPRDIYDKETKTWTKAEPLQPEPIGVPLSEKVAVLDDKINLLSEEINPKNEDEIYKSLDISTVTLDELKIKKIAQLNFLCNQSILAGFKSSAISATPNTYDFDMESQVNLAGMLHAISNNMVKEPILWKASGVPQPHTIEQFKIVYADGLAHKNSKIQRYWTLKSQVGDCVTKEEVNNVNW